MLRYWDGEAGEARALGLLAASSVLPIPILGGGHLAMGAILFFVTKGFLFRSFRGEWVLSPIARGFRSTKRFRWIPLFDGGFGWEGGVPSGESKIEPI